VVFINLICHPCTNNMGCDKAAMSRFFWFMDRINGKSLSILI
jgi:hypothetical protein